MLFKLIAIFALVGLSFGLPKEKFSVDDEELAETLFEGKEFRRVTNEADLAALGIDTKGIEPYIMEDAFLEVPDIIKKYGYPVERHTVVTPDGYILEVHRIPKQGGQPVFLQHGLMDSSGAWIIAGPKVALGYMLADKGYDVWMGNIRGNRYSKNHIDLSIRKKKYWNFSFHEIGSYDVPSCIDYVLEKTGFKKLHYIGHSQGTTSFWTMCIQRPGYCDKILSMNALAPVAFMGHMQSPFLRFLSLFVDKIEQLANSIGMYEFLPNDDFLKMAGQLACKDQSIVQEICSNIIFLVTGYDTDQLNKTMLPVIFGHYPAGSSTKQFIHLGQFVNSFKYRHYDYGWWQNLFTYYGKVSPPDYDLSKVTAPVALHYSGNDWLAQPKDVIQMSNQLPNLIDRFVVPLPEFNHLDFLHANDARSLLYNKVVDIMKKYDP